MNRFGEAEIEATRDMILVVGLLERTETSYPWSQSGEEQATIPAENQQNKTSPEQVQVFVDFISKIWEKLRDGSTACFGAHIKNNASPIHFV